jgi:hypothetical protein
MRFRYLYLDSNGVETKVESFDDLRRCVDDGRVLEDTLLYDALSREWGPARVHTAYRSIIGDTEADASTPDESAMALSDAVPDTVGRFLEKRARERREDDERRPTALDELHLVDQSTEWTQAEVVDDPPTAAPAPEEFPEPEPASSKPVPARPAPSPVTMRVNASGGKARRRGRAVLAGTVVTMAAALVAGQNILGREDSSAAAADPLVDTGPPPAANPELEARIQEAEGSAFRDMMLAMDSLRTVYDVSGGPREWLTGRYLASASDYPDVEAYWRRYRDYVAELSARDEEMFRFGFVRRLETSGLEGAVLSMRLARSTEEFRASGGSRDSVYAAMDGMARAALNLHALLVDSEGDIVYTPVRPGVVTRDPVLEAVPNNAELRNRIWEDLDRLFGYMDVVRGGVPGSGDQLGDAALEGIRSTARRRMP